MEVVEMPVNIASNLVNLLVGVRVSILWQLVGIDEEVASQPPLEIGATTLKMAFSLMIGMVPP